MHRYSIVISISIAALLATLFPLAVGAHASERGFVMLLPTRYYQIGGALAVLASILLFAFLKPGTQERYINGGWKFAVRKSRFRQLTSTAGGLFFLWLISAGFLGSTDPLANPLPLTAWTLFWVLLTLAHAFFGNLWSLLNPWRAPLGWLHRKLPGWPKLKLSESLGYTPAIVGFLAFAWYELISLSPEDPRQLATVLLAYWLFHALAILTFGYQDWMKRGEPFSVFFKFLSLLAPVTRVHGDQPGLRVALPGARLLREPSPGVSGAFFVLISLATVSFDGLNKTFWWLARHDINPLEFAGRSSVISINTLGLVQAIATLSILYLLAVGLGWMLSKPGITLTQGLASTALAIMPISLAYHFSHFLTQVLVNSQYAVSAYSDPYGNGWNLLNLHHFHVTTSFLSQHHTVEILWKLQVASIVVGHIFSVALAHLLALRLYAMLRQTEPAVWEKTGPHRHAVLSQLPLGLVMVGYTLFGLWLLSTPTGA